MNMLAEVLDGWNGYQMSLVNAIAPLTREQLIWQPAPNLRSIGDMARHISLGRVSWFTRMGAPGSAKLVKRIDLWEADRDGNKDTEDAKELVNWLELTWYTHGKNGNR